MPIPSFAPNGTLPPFVGNDATIPANRSPYRTDMAEVVAHFCTSEERARLLVGLNTYRKHLFDGGFVTGYQWIDGSFVENAEVTRRQPPNDIDVTTLFYRPMAFQVDPSKWDHEYRTKLEPAYFATKNMKPKYHCDTYAIDLDVGGRALVRNVTYWFGLFTDIKRSTEKKGILDIPLATDPMEFQSVDSLIRSKFNV